MPFYKPYIHFKRQISHPPQKNRRLQADATHLLSESQQNIRFIYEHRKIRK